MSDHHHDHGNGHGHSSDGHKDAHGHNHEPSLGYVAVITVIFGFLLIWTRSWPGEWPLIAGVIIFLLFVGLVIAPFKGKDDDHGHH
jgi:hypothetical protein